MASKRRALNPTFAAAHGLTEEDDGGVRAPAVSNCSRKRLELIVKEARSTGKLQAVNAGLVVPLPNDLFDLRAGIVIDVSMASSMKGEMDYFVHGEETLTLVDLSDNDCKDSSLDERVLRYEQVQVMRWKRCMLQTVDVDMSSLEHLVVLDLSGNHLRQFRMCWLPAGIQEVDFSKNQLETIEANNTHLDRLISLDLSENKLTSRDVLEGVSWPRLQVFRGHHNPALKELNMGLFFSAQHTLRIFDMAHCQLGFQGEKLDFSMFSELQTILLGFNRLSKIPTIPTSATRVDMTCNRIETIQGLFPDTDDSSSLLELMMQDNHLVELDPDTISRCICLRRLDLSANKLRTIPYQVGFLGQLQQLSVIGNPLYTFKASEIESTAAIMEKLRNRAPTSKSQDDSSSTKRVILSSASVLINNRSIQLSRKQQLDLMQLVAELKANPMLASGITGQLVLDHTRIHSLPDDLLNLLPNVSEVSLRSNEFREIPSSLATSCPKLTRLSMSENVITTLDGLGSHFQSIAWASSLTHLDLSSNRLTTFPGSLLKALTSLQVLTLAFNKVKSVEDWSFVPSTLSQLDLSENSLEDIDNLIMLLGAHCPKLEVLRLHHNCIARIPSITGLLQDRCPDFKFLNLQGNPQQSIRPEILFKPTCEQLAYLKNRLTPEQMNAATDEMAQLRKGGGNWKRTSRDMPSTSTSTAAAATLPPLQRQELTQDMETIEGMAKIDIADSKETAVQERDEACLAEYRSKIADYEKELESASLSQAKRYAVKRSLAMENSKLIREERRLGLRK